MPPHIRFAARPTPFDIQEPPMNDLPPASERSNLRRFFSTLSVASATPRLSRTTTIDSMKTSKTAVTERAPIPSMMPTSDEVYATPLPTLSMVVLSIVSLHLFAACMSSNLVRPCLVNFSPPTSLLRSFFSW